MFGIPLVLAICWYSREEEFGRCETALPGFENTLIWINIFIFEFYYLFNLLNVK